MKLIGFQHRVLHFNDGHDVPGYFFFLSDDTNKQVTGVQTERVFVSDTKCAGYIPKLGDELKINYNKFGKVSDFTIVSLK